MIGYLPEVFSFNQLSLKLNEFICDLAASSPHSLLPLSYYQLCKVKDVEKKYELFTSGAS